MNPFLRDNLSSVLKGKRILLGITGSIAAFKAHDIIRALRECEAEVRVILTESGAQFVTPLTLETLSGNPVLTQIQAELTHIESARWADLFIVAPATANLIGKLAHGLADDLLSTELLAYRGPLLVAPAMNPMMYEHPAVQANVSVLVQRGTRILGPGVGLMACGEEGLGRMIEPEAIVEAVGREFYAPANGKSVLITVGPTRSALDPVRYLTNRSSGRMGAALCWAARKEGYAVTAVCGPLGNPGETPLPLDVQTIPVKTATEMSREVLSRWPDSHVFIGAAAVLDWDIQNPSATKLKKETGAPSLDFSKNTDILAEVSSFKRADQFVLGFAAETGNLIEEATKKLRTKRCDAIFANDVSATPNSDDSGASELAPGFESEQNGGWWIGRQTVGLPAKNKPQLAQEILELISEESINTGAATARPVPPA